MQIGCSKTKIATADFSVQLLFRFFHQRNTKEFSTATLVDFHLFPSYNVDNANNPHLSQNIGGIS